MWCNSNCSPKPSPKHNRMYSHMFVKRKSNQSRYWIDPNSPKIFPGWGLGKKIKGQSNCKSTKWRAKTVVFHDKIGLIIFNHVVSWLANFSYGVYHQWPRNKMRRIILVSHAHQFLLLRWSASKAAFLYSLDSNICAPPFPIIDSSKRART